jgi:hypothetical protein
MKTVAKGWSEDYSLNSVADYLKNLNTFNRELVKIHKSCYRSLIRNALFEVRIHSNTETTYEHWSLRSLSRLQLINIS